MMESLRIERKDIYTIEVNDKGETIEFDLVDVELPFKCEKAWAEYDKIAIPQRYRRRPQKYPTYPA